MSLGQFRVWWPWVVGATVLCPLAAQACDTPVYEYTIRYWERDPYIVYYFYQKSETPGDAAVNERLEQMSKKSHANIWFQRIEIGSLNEGGVRLAQQVWEHYSAQGAPLYVVLTPRRTELFSGRLDLAAVEIIAKSPKRTEMVKLLCEGKQGVLILLKGPKADENKEAERAVRAILTQAKAEEIEVGLVIVSRNDAKEQWFVRQLLALEPDLKDLDNAMVFPVFGRGHVLEPYLGKGITEPNVGAVVGFMNGPCSCEIKMANFGMDLITDWDWEAHVAQLPMLDDAPVEWALFDVEEAPAAAPKQPAEPKALPQESSKKPEKQSSQVKPAEPADAKSRGPASAKRSKPAEESSEPPPAAEEAAALSEEAPRAVAAVAGRVPTLPSSQPPEVAEEEDRASFTSVLGQRLGLVLGGVGVLVVAVGALVLVKARKES